MRLNLLSHNYERGAGLDKNINEIRAIIPAKHLQKLDKQKSGMSDRNEKNAYKLIPLRSILQIARNAR